MNPEEQFCAQKPGLVLEAEGAPLVYATPLAHDLNLADSIKIRDRSDVPLKTDASQGGLVPWRMPLPPLPSGELIGVVKGKWGFDDWEGPRFHLVSAGAGKWTVSPSDESALVVGREDTLHVTGAEYSLHRED